MDTSLILADVQKLNRQFLFAAHDALVRDFVAASYIYQLPKALAARLRQASATQVEELVQSIGGKCVVNPVPNLIDLFDAPEDLVPAVSFVGMHLDFFRERESDTLASGKHEKAQRQECDGLRPR